MFANVKTKSDETSGQIQQLRPFTVITELLLTVISNSYKLLITVILTVISRDLTSYKWHNCFCNCYDCFFVSFCNCFNCVELRKC